jgi:hypothetical protein
LTLEGSPSLFLIFRIEFIRCRAPPVPQIPCAVAILKAKRRADAVPDFAVISWDMGKRHKQSAECIRIKGTTVERLRRRWRWIRPDRRKGGPDLVCGIDLPSALDKLHRMRICRVFPMKKAGQSKHAHKITRSGIGTEILRKPAHYGLMEVRLQSVCDPVSLKPAGACSNHNRGRNRKRAASSGIIVLPDRANAFEVFDLALAARPYRIHGHKHASALPVEARKAFTLLRKRPVDGCGKPWITSGLQIIEYLEAKQFGIVIKCL